MRVVIAGGGTGGHLYPALALAEELQGRGVEPVIFGSTKESDASAVSAAGLRFVSVQAIGRVRGIRVRNLRAVAQLLAAIASCFRALRKLRPDAVVGMGGYVSLPPVVAARLLRIRIVVHEQNKVAGLANRVAARMASAITTSMPGTEFGSKVPVFLTGNPIRRSIAGLDKGAMKKRALKEFDLQGDRDTLVLLGGSQGARTINQVALEIARRLQQLTRVQMLVVAGPKLFEELLEGLKGSTMVDAGDSGNIRILPFTERMDLVYSLADLVVSRAGATTLAELAAVSVPAVLIPLPISIDDDQRKNAETAVSAGGAIMVEDAVASSQVPQIVEELFEDKNRLANMGLSMRKISVSASAAAMLADVLLGQGTPTSESLDMGESR